MTDLPAWKKKEIPNWAKLIKTGKEELNVNFLTSKENKKLIQSVGGNLIRHGVNLDSSDPKADGLSPPTQPLIIMIEGNNITYENFVYAWVSTFGGTGGFRLNSLKLNEHFYYTESSSQNSNMLQKVTYQRGQAKGYLESIQNLKTAIINIESDLEKLEEQMKAFKDGDWETIKSLFIDNFGGAQRSWTALARNVPLIRMAMTWFLRLKVKYNNEEIMPIKKFSKLKIKEKTKKPDEVSKEIVRLKGILNKGATKNKKAMLKEVDKLIEDEQINPAIGNYLKRKIQEFWNWIVNYVDWLTRSQSKIETNLIQQKANLKVYMHWAADHIKQGKRSEMDTSLEGGTSFPEFAFKGSPREIITMDYFFYAGPNTRPDIYEQTRPWIPVILTSFVSGTTMDVPQKFSEMAFITYYGYMEQKNVEMVTQLAKRDGMSLLDTMIDAGAITEEELPRLFSQEEIAEIKGEEENKTKENFEDKLQKGLSTLADNLIGLGGIFGLSAPPANLPWTKERRAASIASDLALRGLENFKKAHGMLLFR